MSKEEYIALILEELSKLEKEQYFRIVYLLIRKYVEEDA